MTPNDLKLLTQLYHDARLPATEMAKQLKMSREQITYRINKFEKEGIIKGYIPIVNYASLGYKHYCILLVKCKNKDATKSIKEKYKISKNRTSTGELLVKYDLYFTLIFKNENEKSEYISDFLQDNHSDINEYLVIEPSYTELFPLKFAGISSKAGHLIKNVEEKTEKIDEKEVRILKQLNINSNMRIIDIASKTNLSAELVVYKIKRLKEKNILLGSRAHFNMTKLGYFYTLLFINTNNYSKKTKENIRDFAQNSKNVDVCSFMLQNPNAYLQVFHKTEEELRKTVIQLKELIKDDSIKIEIIPLVNEGEDINIIPFL